MSLGPHSVGLTVCLCLLAGNAVGQESEERGTSIIPFPFVFYQPETKMGVGGTVVTMFHLSSETEQEQPSSLSPIFAYTQKNQIIALLETELFLGGGRYRVNASGGYSKFPNTVWSIGNDASDDPNEDYTPRVFQTTAQFQARLAPGWFAGASLEFANRRLIEIDTGGMLAAGELPGTDDGSVVSGGMLLTWDTRDNTVNPGAGWYHQFKASVSDPVLGSDYAFSRYTVDVRQYVTAAPGHVFAFRGLGVASSGTLPFDVLPQLGGEELLRGYYGGRYRDKNLVAFQAEYRMLVWKRLGAIGFVSAGRVAEQLSELDFGGFKPAAGLGLRFLLAPDEGLNLRADFGFGKGSSGFYLGLGEVF